ncbi:MAG TPA: excinuclease ABC subunit UvrA [Planctomycetota bacterium]|nr:excinuclease ABC subunit UvrA [Planctomycetota bacterium]
MDKVIAVRGAAEHNLKHIDVDIPRDRLVVITGLSGSGKSSLAFDTLYAEGQRRYVESLSAYARQFLQQMQKPDVEYIEGLPPTISIEQRSGLGTPRSTVATTTEIYDYMRLLYARVGEPHCPKCGKPISQQTPQQIVHEVLRLPEGTRIMVMSPLVRGRKGEHKDVFQHVRREGFVRARIDGEVTDLKRAKPLDKNRAHTVEAVVDRLVLKDGVRSRLADSIETALTLGEGLVVIAVQQTPDTWEDHVFSELYACVDCNISIEELSPRLFSFNSPYGACLTCDGLGTRLEFDPDLIVPDPGVSLADGAIDAWRRGGKRMAIYYSRVLRNFCHDFGVSRSTPFNKLPNDIQKVLLHGTTPKQAKKYGVRRFEGVLPNLERRFERTASEYVKQRLHGYMSELACPDCGGARLRPESLAVTIDGHNIHQITRMSIAEALAMFEGLRLTAERKVIAHQILKEIRARLGFMVDVGLSYLTLDRISRTLAGGEAQRIRLATQVGSGLVGVCYVLDEPSIGLHQRDNRRLLDTLVRLRDLGNTVIVVEHDEETIRSADHIIDLGPGAGAHGGEVVAQGPLEAILAEKRSVTGAYLGGREQIDVPPTRRKILKGDAVTVYGAREHNLKNITVKVPLGVFTCVTGVSGSGKSTLVSEILHRALMRRLHHSSRVKPGDHDRLSGVDRIDKVIEIDQSPIGRTPRSNPATYTNVLDLIRQLFARIREAKIRGYKPGRFSFNVKGGRCEACQGQGTKKIEMHFLPDIYVVCEECKGRRFNRETLEIRWKGKNIAEVLDMTVEEALRFFTNFPKVKRILETLYDVGLGYVQLGQSSTTLSGGEAQRVKLASELGKASTGRTFYILDEPTTGLHFADIHRLLHVLNRLTDLGNTALVIEHNMDVIKCADWIIDLGPEGGDAGGEIVAEGTPEQVAKHPTSYTGKVLKAHLPK